MTAEWKPLAEEIVSTLQQTDNESTASPYWLIIDPTAVTDRLRWLDEDTDEERFADLTEESVKNLGSMIPHCIEGPFFSRKDAEDYLKARRYAYSKETYIYCNSGYRSDKYRSLCEQILPGSKVPRETKT